MAPAELTAPPQPGAGHAAMPGEPIARPWRAALLVPLPVAAAWAVGSHAAGLSGFFASAGAAVLMLTFATATYTDVRWRRVYNWTTYSAALLAVPLVAAAAALPVGSGVSLGGRVVPAAELFGTPSPAAAWGGFAIGFGILLAIYIVFDGGGGDLKLVAAAGCYVGPMVVLEGLINTYILAGAGVGAYLGWKVGPVALGAAAARRLAGPFEPWLTFLGKPVELQPYLGVGVPMAPFYAAGFLAAAATRL